MNLLMVKTTECRVGVIGLYNSGKTVFLTSLINHLEHHDPDRFRLKVVPGREPPLVRRFRTLPVDRGWSQFNYAGYRDALVYHGRWPEKTTDRAQFNCRFERTDWQFSDLLLKLYDLPGERLADAVMLGRSYTQWSDHLLGVMQNDTPYRQLCDSYLSLLQRPNLEEEELLANYRLALARLILAYKPLISPSTFLVDLAGTVARPASAEVLAQSRLAGLSEAQQFAPLPERVCRAHPQIANKFAQSYSAYVRQVANPFMAALRQCHALVILVDVPTILSAGVGMYDDNREILADLFRALEPGETLMGTLGRNLAHLLLPRELRPVWTNRVAFVAPKMDLVHPDDRDNALALLKSLTKRFAAERDGLKADYFNIAAVISTQALTIEKDRRQLVGIPFRGPDGKRVAVSGPQKFTVSAVPPTWPTHWQPGEYSFPEVYPAIPSRKDHPPDQLNLDRVLGFILGD